MGLAASAEMTDEQLVEAARAGNDEAFEVLFRRYRARMAGFVRNIVGDESKAEDIVQESFMSALRSMRATEREIAFKPWMFQIARNACIDHLRSQRRAEEVSIHSEDFLAHDESRLSQFVPATEASAAQREDLTNLRRAFDGLPDSQREILALRELGGLSYDEIGERVGLSKSAVESVLFRARRGLKEEYDEIATGDRCHLMRTVMAQAAEGLGTTRDRRKLLRHLRDCLPCRREAMVMGLGRAAFESGQRGRVRRVASRAVALFPLPVFFHRREADVAAGNAPASGGRGHDLLTTLGLLAGRSGDQTVSIAAKGAALVAAAALAGGGVIATKELSTHHSRGAKSGATASGNAPESEARASKRAAGRSAAARGRQAHSGRKGGGSARDLSKAPRNQPRGARVSAGDSGLVSPVPPASGTPRTTLDVPGGSVAIPNATAPQGGAHPGASIPSLKTTVPLNTPSTPQVGAALPRQVSPAVPVTPVVPVSPVVPVTPVIPLVDTGSLPLDQAPPVADLGGNP